MAQTSDAITISSFKGDQTSINEIAALHLQIRQWQVDIGQTTFPNILDSQVDLKKLDEYYLSGGGNFFVARVAETGELVGFVGLRNEGKGIGIIKRLAVKPEYHRRHVATRLMDALMQWARNNGFTFLKVQTSHDENALPIYQKHGFRTVSFIDSTRNHVLELNLTK